MTLDQRDEVHLALGRYIDRFSILVNHIRGGVREIVGRHTNEIGMLVDLVTGEMTAQPLANAFFGLCAEVYDQAPEEEAVTRRLRNRINDHITMRNHVAHGDWYIYWDNNDEGAPMPAPIIQRISPTRKGGPRWHLDMSKTRLDELTSDMQEIGNIVSELSHVVGGDLIWTSMERQPRRISDLFVVRDGEIRREGPRAPEGGWSAR